MAERPGWMEIAERQHGVVGRGQLSDLGVTSKAVRHAVARGRLSWLTPRVLRVCGSAGTPLQRAMAATLDSSGGAVALASSLAMWGVPGWLLEPLHVITTRRPHRGGPHLGIVHSAVRLTEDDIAEVSGVPVTTPARTLVDLSIRLRPGKVEDLCDDLLRRRLLSVEKLESAVDGLPARGGPSGFHLLRRLAARRAAGYRPTGSRLERRFEQILEKAGDRPFERQIDVGDEHGWIGRVDFVDRNLRVIVEVQSETFHSSLSDRRRDAERIGRLRAAGWIVVEVTEHEIFHRSDLVLRRVRAARELASSRAA